MATNVIALNRGDSFDFDLTIAVCSALDCDRYILQGNDAIYFGIMDPNQPFEEALVRKKYTTSDLDDEGNLIIHLAPDDTIDLLPGKYYYMIKLKQDHTEEDTQLHISGVRTIINKTKFVLYD